MLDYYLHNLLFQVNYWIRGHLEHTNNKDHSYVLGGNYETLVDNEGVYKVVMKLVLRISKISDFGIYKCIAKNAIGSSEESIKVIRKYLTMTTFTTIFLFHSNKIVKWINTKKPLQIPASKSSDRIRHHKINHMVGTLLMVNGNKFFVEFSFQDHGHNVFFFF